MTSLPQDSATANTRALALEMFKDNVPCALSLEEPPCPHRAAWVVHFVHLSAAHADCDGQPPVPLCPEHTRLLRQATHPFWRAWLNTDPALCPVCGSEVTVDRIEAIT